MEEYKKGHNIFEEIDDSWQKLTVTHEFSEMCSKLGGKFDVTELSNGADMFCHLKNMEINYIYIW